MVVKASVPGTCGELAQGWFEGEEALISLPVRLRGYVALSDAPFEGARRASSARPKTRRALEVALRELGAEGALEGLWISGGNPFPEGVGMASSTVDVASSVAAVFSLLRGKAEEEAVARLSCAVEASDGVMVEGLCLFRHLSGEVLERFSAKVLEGLSVVWVIPPWRVATEEYRTPSRRAQVRALEGEFAGVLELMREALEEADEETLFEATTRDSLLHERVLPKGYLDVLLSARELCGRGGLVVAHSGSGAGLILRGEELAGFARSRLREALPSSWWIWTLRAGGGGIEVEGL